MQSGNSMMKNNFESNPAENKEEKYEISKEAIREVFESEKFKDTFLKTLKGVHRHRRELGFLIAREIASGNFHYSKPIGGEFEEQTYLGVAFEEMEKIFEKRGIEREQWYTLIKCHFHGFESEESRVLCPSFLDLEAATYTREINRNDIGGIGFDIPPIEMIGV